VHRIATDDLTLYRVAGALCAALALVFMVATVDAGTWRPLLAGFAVLCGVAAVLAYGRGAGLTR
jgi:hypothetical protein